MKYLMHCNVVGYCRNSAIVELETGKRCYLPSIEISDINIPIDEKVYPGQSLLVTVEPTEGGLRLGHKELMMKKEDFLAAHSGEMVKARVVFTTERGCMLELDGNTYCYTYELCNLRPGVFVWASISPKGRVHIDSVLYEEQKQYYPIYRYPFAANRYVTVAEHCCVAA